MGKVGRKRRYPSPDDDQNRRLLKADYFSLMLFGMLNPMVDSSVPPAT